MTISLPGGPLTLNVDQALIDDLLARLNNVRLPSEQAGPDWATGTPLSFMQRLLDHWRSGFNWRDWENRINAFDNRLVDIDGVKLHVLVEQGSGDNPLPLVLTNGWPGSFLEYLAIIEPLAHPERHGGKAEDAFTVIIPSLPGYGLSPAPATPLSPRDIAGLWSRLMVEVFGLGHFGALGSDWGSLVTSQWASHYPQGLCGVFLTMGGGVPSFDENSRPLSEAEIAWQQRAKASNIREGAYQALQATKPQSLAFGFADSPAALAAWISEKFRGWSVPDAAGDPPMTMDDMIANIMLYWINGATAPLWLYTFLGQFAQPSSGAVRPALPVGFLLGGGDLIPPAPREWLERSFDVTRYSVSEQGGHFPGYDNSAMLVSELREFFRQMR